MIRHYLFTNENEWYWYYYVFLLLCVLQAQPTQKTKIAGVLMEVVVNTTTTFMVTGLMAPATDRWPVVDAAKVTRESTARWPYVGQVVPMVVTVSIRMFVRVLMDILEPDVKQVPTSYLLIRSLKSDVMSNCSTQGKSTVKMIQYSIPPQF